MFAKKPFLKGFMKAKKELELENGQIAVVRRPNIYRHCAEQIERKCIQYLQNQ